MLYKSKNLILPEGITHYPRVPNDARQYTRDQITEEINVKTPSGDIMAQNGDYMLTDNNSGENWVCKAANFEEVFEQV